MSRWVEAFNNSNLEQNARKLETLLKRAIFKTVTVPNNSDVRRLRYFSKIVTSVVKKLNPEIIALNHVNALSNTLNNINNHLENFVNSQDINYLRQAADQVDSGIANIQNLLVMEIEKPIVSSAMLTRTMQKSEESIRKIAGKTKEYVRAVTGLKTQIKNQERKVKMLDAQANKKVGQLDKRLIDFDKNFLKAQNERATTFQESQRKQTSQFNAYFMKTQKENSIAFDKILLKFNKEITDEKKSTFEELNQIKKNSKEKHDELLSIVGLASHDALRGQHKLASDEEQKSFIRWRKISFASMIIAAIYAGYMFHDNSVYSNAHLTAPVLIILLSAAAYSGRIAAGHRREAIRVRQFSLEMEAILPYLDALERSDAESKALRSKLAEKFFGNLPPLETGQSKNETHLTDSTLQDIKENLATLVKIVLKK